MVISPKIYMLHSLKKNYLKLIDLEHKVQTEFIQ